ncbi:MAG: SIMPL domain-containing protein [Clostridiales bacterium]|nr:SIMPL domain-containing protein [Clostridiales bacterium]
MKKTIAISLVLLILVASSVALAQGNTPSPGRESTLTATGSAVVTLQPDFATLSLGVVAQAETVADAQAQNAVQMTAVLAALEKAGVAREDIQTSYFTVNPVYGDTASTYEMSAIYPNPSGKPVGYRVENTLQVTLRDIGSIGSTLDEAMKAGANQSYGISFESTQKAQAYDKALQEAVKEARRKAELMAQAVGQTLGSLVELLEQNAGYGGGYMKTMAMDAAYPGTPIVSGMLNVEASVQVTYQLP